MLHSGVVHQNIDSPDIVFNFLYGTGDRFVISYIGDRYTGRYIFSH